MGRVPERAALTGISRCCRWWSVNHGDRHLSLAHSWRGRSTGRQRCRAKPCDRYLMDALLGLGGAIIGGFLVLLGDAARRRAQRRHDGVLRLSEASVAYAVVIGRLFARARDAYDRGQTPADERPERYEASLRFS